MKDKYREIINMPPPTSERHKRMPTADRAAQFSPFSALTGFGAAVAETERLTEHKPLLCEDAKQRLDCKMQLLLNAGYDVPATFTYFLPDKRKEGGAYVSTIGCIKSIDEINRTITLSNSKTIPIDDVLDIESSFFVQIEE